ncbi:MAG: hypothetical protein O7C58_06810, partial [Rickettsia endosymbiont of Ixodes persulcatus]|nr:hypothetical protein [Rickettsia endosymbiont of Ixodes persulcatus]
MTREEVEDKFGTSNGSVESLKWSYETYGDLAVAYDDNEVVSVGVAPNHISEDQFLSMYNEPDDRNSSQLIYDSNKDNDFSVLVNVKNGDVTVIENVQFDFHFFFVSMSLNVFHIYYKMTVPFLSDFHNEGRISFISPFL